LVGRLVLQQEAGLRQHRADPAQLARVFVHLAGDLALALLQLLLQVADLAVLLQQLAKARRADDLQLALALHKALGLDLQAVREALRAALRPRLSAPSTASLMTPSLAPHPPELDANRPPAVFKLEVLGHVVDRHVGVVPHAADVGQPLTDAAESLIRLVRGEPLLAL